MLRTSSLYRFPTACWLGALVTACGGGGGGGGPAQGGGQPPPSGTLLRINVDNALDVGFMAFAGSELIDNFGACTAVNGLDMYRDGDTEREGPCSTSGTVRVAIVDDGDQLFGNGDRVRFELIDCNGTNGLAELVVTGFVDDSAQTSLAGPVTYDVRYASGVRVHGGHEIALTLTADEAHWIHSDATLTIDWDGAVDELRQARVEFVLGADDEYDISLSGTVASGYLGGSYPYRTSAPLHGQLGSYPSAGVVPMTGANSSVSFGANPADHGLTRYELDSNGDGQIEFVDVYAWDGFVGGSLFGISSRSEQVNAIANRSPEITSITMTPEHPLPGDALSVAATWIDPDGDPLTVTYAWTRNGSPVLGVYGTQYPADAHEEGDVIAADVFVTDGEAGASAVATVTIEAPPMRLVATDPPAQVLYGQPVSFRALVADGSGTPLPNAPAVTYALDYGPAGMVVDPSTGWIDWTPTGPLFDRQVEVRWAVRTTNRLVGRVTGTLTLVDDDRAYPLMRGGDLSPVSHAGLIVDDLDDDGTLETLVLGGHTLYELAWDGTAYRRTWMYPFALEPGRIPAAMAAGDIDGDGSKEIFVCAGTRLLRLGGPQRRVQASTVVGVTSDGDCRQLALMDVDADGQVEIVGVESQSNGHGTVFVLRANDLALEWRSASMLVGQGLAVGNVDADPPAEIVTMGGTVFDGLSKTAQWTIPGPEIYQLATGDLDGDGVHEIVLGDGLQFLRAFDARTGTELAALERFDIDVIEVRDVVGDGSAEVLLGDGQFGNVTVLALDAPGQTFQSLHTIASPGHGVLAIATGDVDGDDAPEIVWGPGLSSQEVSLAVAGFNPDLEPEWQNDDPGVLYSFAGGAVARDGSSGPVLGFVAGHVGAFGGPRIVTLDASDGSTAVGREIAAQTAAEVDILDLDENGSDDFIIGTDDGFLSYDLFGLDMPTWTSPADLGYGAIVRHLDVTGDGRDDLVGLTTGSSTGGDRASSLYVFDALDRTLVFEWALPGYMGSDLEITDLNGDGVPELIVASAQFLSVLTKVPGAARYTVTRTRDLAQGREIVAVAAGDTDGDGTPEIYAAMRFHDVIKLDSNLDVLSSYPVPRQEENTDVIGVEIEALAFTRKNLTIMTSRITGQSYGHIVVIDPDNGTEISRSPPIAGLIVGAELNYVDIAENGNIALSYATTLGIAVTR